MLGEGRVLQEGLILIDVIIVAYRTGDVLPRCLESIRADPSVGHVYIVDNSPGHPLGVLSSEGVTIVEPGENLGFGNGVNAAAPLVSTEYVAVVNPDLVVQKGVFGKCVDFLDENHGVGLLSPRVYVDGLLFRTSEHDASLPRYLSHPVGLGRIFGVERPTRHHYRTHETDAVNGAFMVARTSALEQIGWFDRSIFLFGEEIDMCRRLRRSGWKVVYLADGRVDHLDGYSAALEDDRVIRQLRRSARVEQLRRARGVWQARVYSVLLGLRP
ncbi:glycosyltransferase family 2 protein [Rhodococcus sp. NPDC019627]|uniref:glycosyltransferase family 2 protein n=1 Tax=unclassified Rhodococcus (in: high G+C Gram-positive bacteria) TaxID=192944 RepID=UPI0033F4F825